MSELSRLFVANGFKVLSETQSGPRSFKLSAERGNNHLLAEVYENTSLSLSITTFSGWKNVLTSARKLATQFMGAEPICRFEFKSEGLWLHMLEWELRYPEHHLRSRVNLSDGLAQVPVHDLRVLGDYCLSDFQDQALLQANLEAAALHQQFTGVYGRDPANCNLLRIREASQLGLFLEYNDLLCARVDIQEYNDRFSASEDLFSQFTHGLTALERQEKQLALATDFVAFQICQKNDIKLLAEPSTEYRLRFRQRDFKRWYKFYGEYLERFDDATLAQLNAAYTLGEDISAYEPAEDWHKPEN